MTFKNYRLIKEQNRVVQPSVDLEKRLAMHFSKITAKKSSPVADMAAAVVQAAVQEQQQQLTQQHLALAVQAVQNSSNGVLVSEFFFLFGRISDLNRLFDY